MSKERLCAFCLFGVLNLLTIMQEKNNMKSVGPPRHKIVIYIS